MRIGQLALASGVSTDTIRYYEKIGLLPRAERSESAHSTSQETYVGAGFSPARQRTLDHRGTVMGSPVLCSTIW